MLIYAVELYADFTGGIDITIGIAELFGIRLPENFRQPFSQRVLQNIGEDGISHFVHGLRIMYSIRFPCQRR